MNIILPIDRKFLCQHRNEDDFNTNPTTDFVPYIQGQVIEKLKLVAQYEVSTVTEASIGEEINAATDSGTIVKLTHPFSDWGGYNNEGFVVGNTVYVEANGNNTTGTVTSIVGNCMYIDATNFFTNLGVVDGDWRDDFIVRSTQAPTTLRYAFGLVPNSQATPTFASLLNGETQLYTGSGISAVSSTLNYAPNPATDLGSVEVKLDSTTGPGGSVFTFTIEHIFRVPHFIAAWLINYQNGTVPPEFQGNESWKYVNNMNFGNNINNPNEGKVFEDNFQLGSIGFLGQNFNTGSIDYSSANLSITTPLLSDVDEPEVTEVNSFVVDIVRSSGNFNAGVKAYLYISKLPSESEYTDSNFTYEENFVLDQLSVLAGAGTSSASIIKNYEANIDGGDPTTLTLEFDIEWSTAQQLKLDPGDEIIVEVIVEDGTLTAPLSDRASVEIYQGTVQKNTDISGLMSGQQMDIYSAAVDVALATPTSSIDTWINRAYLIRGSFDLTKFSNSDDGLLQSFKVQMVSRIPSTNTFFQLSEYIFPLGLGKIPGTIVPVSGTGYQSIGINTTRQIGNVPSTSELAEVQLISEIPGVFSATQAFTWRLGIEVPHREWIFNASAQAVAPEFYDGGLPDEFFNFNQRASNYSSENSFEIYIFATANILKDGIVTTYHHASDVCEVADFDEDVIGTGYSAVTKYYDLNDIEIDVPYQGEDCKVEVTITHPAGAAEDAGGEIVFEYTGETGLDHRLSSVKDWSGATNALKGLPADITKVDVDQPDAFTTVLTAVIKGSFLFDGVPINSYGHLLINR